MRKKINLLIVRTSIQTLLIISFLILATLSIGVEDDDEYLPYKLTQINNPSPQAGAIFGTSVDGISDIDGDDIGDLVIGAPGADRVYILSGADQSIIHTLQDPDDLSGYWFGYSVQGIGDIDGDGVEDIAVGAPHNIFDDNLPVPDVVNGPNPTPVNGRVFIFSGSNGNLVLRLLPEDWDFDQYGYYWGFGCSVQSLGDINNDGITDIAVGSTRFATMLGMVFVFSCADGAQIWCSVEPSPVSLLKQSRATFGMFMDDVEDLTGDGHNDLLVGAPYHDFITHSKQWLFSGRGFILDGSDGSIFRTHDNPSPYDENFFGADPCSIGDQDEDGIEDYAFGKAGAGIVYLYSGATGNSFHRSGAFSVSKIKSPDKDKNDLFGSDITKVDDKDGDGLVDFWISAPNTGKVYLMNSWGHLLLEVKDLNQVVQNTRFHFGRSASATDDLDGKSGFDLIVGKPFETLEGFNNAGAASLVLEISVTNGVPYTAWLHQFGYTNMDIAYDISVASSKLYVAGALESSSPGTTGATGMDAFVRKYDDDGQEIWTRQFGNSLDDCARGITVYSSAVYVIGEVYGALPGQSSTGNYFDAFIRKYDIDGNEIWTRQIGTSDTDKAFGVAADSSGVYVVGTTMGSFPLCSNAGGSDIFICKYDHNGNEIGVQQFGSTAYDYASGICVDSSGLYIAGYVDGTLPGQTGVGGTDGFVCKFDLNGIEKWTKQFGTPGYDRVDGISIDSSGIYMAGATTGAFPGFLDAIGTDIFICKFDHDGNEDWIRQFGTYYNESAYDITVDLSGVYITGYTFGKLTSENNKGFSDVFLRKYDLFGEEKWTYQFGSPKNDWGYGIAVESPGIYVAGSTMGDFLDYTNEGFYDAFVARLGARIPVIMNEGKDIGIIVDPQVRLDFDRIIEPGYTDLRKVYDIPEPDIPGYTIIGPFYDITTTAKFANDVNINIIYEDSEIPVDKETSLTLFHCEDNKWEEVKTEVDIGNNIISGFISSFSYFAVAYPDYSKIEIDIHPDTSNLNSKGRYITCYIELSRDYDAAEIDVRTILLNNIVPAQSKVISIGDYDKDGITDLLVCFERSAVIDILEPGENVEITITGKIGTEEFKGFDTFKVIDKGK
ncbi:MAG: FG-GAP repeat protein [Thermoplasmata archaeon]|nr:MAG: FG-GAP repeat protein [Thermoplasmata archaeon]